MDLMEDPSFKTKYQKNKLRVKLWESDFMDKYGRKPNKNDIKDADVTIREAYKMYWKLKTRALEETLMDITFCDDAQSNTNTSSKSNAEKITEDRRNVDEGVGKDTENIDPHSANTTEDTNSKLLYDVGIRNVEGTWGDHLSKANEVLPKKKQSLLIGRSSSFQLAQNKFTSCAKRNPRKSLSSTKVKTKSDSSIAFNNNKSDQADIGNKEDGFDINEEIKPVFGEPMKVSYGDHKPVSQSVNTVQQLIEGHTVSRNLNQGWLERCSKENNVEFITPSCHRLSGMSDSGVESMESSIHSPNESKILSNPMNALPISDEEDFICNSDSEEERKNKRIRNFKKRLSDQDGHAKKRLCTQASPNSQEIAKSCITDSLSSKLDVLNVSNKNDNICKLTDSVNLHDVTENKIVQDKTNIILVSTEENSKCDNASNAKENEEMLTHATTKINDTGHRKTSVSSRTVAKKNKITVSDDSDPEFTRNSHKSNKPKRVTRRKSTVKEGTNIKSDLNSGESKEVRTTRRKRSTKKKVHSDDIEEKESEDLNLQNTKEVPIYGIETLQAVPRLNINVTENENLVTQFSKSICSTSSNSQASNVIPKPKGQLSDKEKLEQKVAAGKVNENFVRINLKKKVFVRGKKTFNFSKYKKNQWKQRKKDLASGESNLDKMDYLEKNGGALTCFKCGGTGHFARFCTAAKGDDLIALEEIDESSQFPTLEEAEKMASEKAVVAHSSRMDRLPKVASVLSEKDAEVSEEHIEDTIELLDADFTETFEVDDVPQGHKIPEALLSRLLPPEVGVVHPLYAVNGNNSLIETPPEVFETLQMFGHENFRPGQEKAIMRILSGQSTLVTLSTGSGKSLCYQLPAYLYSKHSTCITLVISPLVSLMDDQVTGVPLFLSAACLHTNQPPKVRENIIEMVKQGKVNILLVSPEAVVAGEKSTGFGALLRQLPPIAFACIDEAHCISQWSHNFRPSYLMVCRVLKEKLGVRTILGLTATATRSTAESIVKHLSIHDGVAGIISDVPMPKNLLLSISKDENRDHALVALLRSERFKECNSVIVYCTRREECVRIAGVLRISLQDQHKSEKPNTKVSAIAETYHAGLTAHRRKVVQKAFMSGQTRIVVATVAFGMGINKSDIRSVIHYNMPGTFEGYVQEVGRAGRDGIRAHCHLFLNPGENRDKWELRRHIYATGVDRHTIRRLLQKVFLPCSCSKIRTKLPGQRCPGHEVAIPVDETVSLLDISEETISTLLCYLELHPKRFITVLSSVYVKARVSSYQGPQGLKAAAQSSPPLAMAIAMDLKNGISHENSSIIEFPVVDIASAIGWDSGVVKSHLKNLEWTTVDGRSKRSAISVRYDTLGLRVKAPGDLTESELDEALEALVARALSQQTSSLQQLEIISTALNKFSTPSVEKCLVLDEEMEQKSDELKNVIRDYFRSETLLNNTRINQQNSKLENEAEIVQDVRSLVLSYRDNNFTGRAVARIFHGIQSPNYPALVWGKCRFWRAHISSDFNLLCQVAIREILALR
ncbi:hypothetical protein KM043_010785 [Ampulex compressa]|nr:hypothetical protein KM043_010785 [Ampulex compressa]